MDRFFPSQYSSEPWFRVGTVDVTTTILVSAASVASMFVWAINRAWLDPFVFYSSEVRSGEVWRLVTWPIANGPSIWTVISIAIFFLFGREIERALGRARYLWFLGILTVVPALVGTLVGLEGAAGLRWLNLGVFLAFVLMYPTARSWFDIPLWVFGVVFIGIEVLQLIGLRDQPQAVETLIFLATTLAVSALMTRGYGLTEIEWIPRLPMPAGERRAGGGRQRKAKAPKTHRRHRGQADVIPIRNSQPTPADLLRQAEVDLLLDKISEHGLSSLTPEERRRLDEHSRRLRDER